MALNSIQSNELLACFVVLLVWLLAANVSLIIRAGHELTVPPGVSIVAAERRKVARIIRQRN